MEPYYELHISVEARDLPDGLPYGWRESGYSTDGGTCYISARSDLCNQREGAVRKLLDGVAAMDALGFAVERAKVELVVYDTKHGVGL